MAIIVLKILQNSLFYNKLLYVLNYGGSDAFRWIPMELTTYFIKNLEDFKSN